MDSDESHFNVSLIVRDKVARRLSPPITTFFEERGEPKRTRTEVLLLTSLTPCRWAKPVHAVATLSHKWSVKKKKKKKKNATNFEQIGEPKRI